MIKIRIRISGILCYVNKDETSMVRNVDFKIVIKDLEFVNIFIIKNIFAGGELFYFLGKCA